MLVLRMKWPEMSHDAALGAGLERFTQRTKTVDSCCKWSPSKDFLCKSFGIDAAGWSENAFVSKSMGVFLLPSVKNKGDKGAWASWGKCYWELCGEQRFCSNSLLSVSPNRSNSEKPEHSKALFLAVSHTISSLWKYTAPVLCRQNVRASSVSLPSTSWEASKCLSNEGFTLHSDMWGGHEEHIEVQSYPRH